MTSRIHVIFDPLCGWCYALHPALHLLAGLETDAAREIVLHPGLLFQAPTTIAHGYRQHILAADQRIAELSGVRFSAAYQDKIRHAATLQFDSRAPSAAVMAMAADNVYAGMTMLAAVQDAHYVQAQDVSDLAVLTRLALAQGMAEQAFLQRYQAQYAALPVTAADTHRLMREAGIHGFPGLVLEQDGRWQTLDHQSAYGRPQQWLAQLQLQLQL